jgi:hypothetical protein
MTAESSSQEYDTPATCCAGIDADGWRKVCGGVNNSVIGRSNSCLHSSAILWSFYCPTTNKPSADEMLLTGHMRVLILKPLSERVLSMILGTDMPAEMSSAGFVRKFWRYQSVVPFMSICVSVRPLVCHLAYALRSVMTACAGHMSGLC